MGHVIVVELIVAEGHVHVEGQVLPVVQQDPLVDVNGLLVVGPKVVDGGQGQLILFQRGCALEVT